MDDIGWKYLIVFNIAICLEVLVIYFFYPETQGRTLEELAFCTSLSSSIFRLIPCYPFIFHSYCRHSGSTSAHAKGNELD